VQPDSGGPRQLLRQGRREDDAKRLFDREDRVVIRIRRALPDQGQVKLARFKRAELCGACRVPEVYLGVREDGAHLGERARQQAGWKLKRQAHPQRRAARRRLA